MTTVWVWNFCFSLVILVTNVQDKNRPTLFSSSSSSFYFSSSSSSSFASSSPSSDLRGETGRRWAISEAEQREEERVGSCWLHRGDLRPGAPVAPLLFLPLLPLSLSLYPSRQLRVQVSPLRAVKTMHTLDNFIHTTLAHTHARTLEVQPQKNNCVDSAELFSAKSKTKILFSLFEKCKFQSCPQGFSSHDGCPSRRWRARNQTQMLLSVWWSAHSHSLILWLLSETLAPPPSAGSTNGVMMSWWLHYLPRLRGSEITWKAWNPSRKALSGIRPSCGCRSETIWISGNRITGCFSISDG